jgi:hypothetical protein
MSYPVTGPAAIFGSHVTDTPKLAFAAHRTMGGPKFNMILKDNKSGDPQAGVQSVRELGFAHVPMMLTSEVADLGAELTGIKQYKIFSLDGSGGTSLFAQARKYFWGTIAITPNDAIPGVVKFMQHAWPSAKRIAFCGWDLGGLSDMVETTRSATSRARTSCSPRTSAARWARPTTRPTFRRSRRAIPTSSGRSSTPKTSAIS